MHKTLKILTSFAILALLSTCTNEPDTTAPAQTETNPLIIIGIDGATWDVIDPMLARGELPNLAQLKARGAYAQLITVGPQVSPVVWTTFSTGQFGRQHGILDFVYPYQPGPKRPVQSVDRRSPALWNLVSEAGKKISVVGYFVTYPAEKINGAMVSYRSPQKQPGTDYPADVLAPIRARLDTIKSSERKAIWSQFLPWDFDPKNPPAQDDSTAEAFRMVKDRVARRIQHAEYNRRAALYLADTPNDVFITYFHLVDFASHSLWKYYDDTDFEIKADPETKRLLGDVIPQTYRFMDQFIGDLLEKSPQNTNIVILSDHGTGSATGIFSVKEKNRSLLNGNHRPNGVFLAAGPAIEAGRIDGLTIIDVFPALAYLAGLPVADDLPGELTLELFTDAQLNRQPPAYTRAYKNTDPIKTTTAEASREAQKASVKSLQGLGYVGESFELGHADTQAFNFWDAEQELIIQHLKGELCFHLIRGDDSVATEILAEARSHDELLPAKILTRSQRALQSIRDSINAQAVPDSAMAFIVNARRKITHNKQQKASASANN